MPPVRIIQAAKHGQLLAHLQHRDAMFGANASWLMVTFHLLEVSADVAIAEAERLLQAADGDPWGVAAILTPLSLLYAYAGRFAGARAASARGRAMQADFGAKLAWAVGAISAGQLELVAGAPAERYLREAHEALVAMRERGYRAPFPAYSRRRSTPKVSRLAGAPGEAEDSLRAALRIYEDRRAVPLAEQANAALTSLTGQPAPTKRKSPAT